MITPYRQPIAPHNRGMDVLATQRALDDMGYHKVGRTGYAGINWEAAIRMVQHNHRLHVDGIYGSATHKIVAAHFDKYGVYLYTHAKIRHHRDYVNPFRNAHVQIGRIDEGVDYHGTGPIEALGAMVVYGVGGSGWPDGHYINCRLTEGRHAGRFVYLAEAIVPKVYHGQHLKPGAVVADFRYDAAPGMYPGIEYGWGSSTTNLTWAAVTGRTGPPPFSDTPPGLAFARFLDHIGAPAPRVGSGAEFV